MRITHSMINAAERDWQGRAAAPGAPKTKAARLKAQADFFTGAMSAWNAAGFEGAMSPRWVFCVMRGDDIADLSPLPEDHDQ